MVRVDPSAQNTRKHARVGRVRADRSIELVWSSPEPIVPIAYPGTRSSQEWEALLDGYRKRWNGHWSNPGTEAGGAAERAALGDRTCVQ